MEYYIRDLRKRIVDIAKHAYAKQIRNIKTFEKRWQCTRSMAILASFLLLLLHIINFN